jgi:hypothetical protein
MHWQNRIGGFKNKFEHKKVGIAACFLGLAGFKVYNFSAITIHPATDITNSILFSKSTK